MDYSKHATEHKVKILDYFTMDILNEDGVTFASPDGKLRGSCNLCGRSYCGTVRVKSNFITHLRKNHPIQYSEFRIANGKHDIAPAPKYDLDQVEDLRTSSSSTMPGSMMQVPRAEYAMVSNGYTITPSGSQAVPSQVVKLGAAVNARVAVKPERQISSIHQQKKRELLEAMASLITDDMVPTKLMESPRFKKLMNVAGVHDIPVISDIETHIAMQAETCQENIKDELIDASHVWLTIQAWTQSTNLSYVTIDAHFLSDWCFRHITCYCHEIDTQDLKKHIGLIKYGLDMLNITYKTTGTITGLTAIISLPTIDANRSTSPSINTQHVNFKLAGFSLYSLEASLGELVRECLINCGDETLNLLSKSLTLVKLLDAPTLTTQKDIDNIAWYKQIELLHKVAKMDAMTKANLKEVTEEDKLLTSREQELLNTVLSILTPFKEVAQRIGSTTEISSSLVIPAIKILQASLQELINATRPHQLAQELNKHLPKHVQEKFMLSKALQLSTILDPRFKIQWCNKSEEETMKSLLHSEIQTVDVNPEVTVEIKPAINTGSGFFSKILKQEPSANSDGTKSVEVYRYLDEPIISEESDPLKYWRLMEEKLPHLTKLAKVYMAIPMSSSNVETLYSCPGQVYSPRSTSLQDDILENVVLVRANNISNSRLHN